MSIFFCANLAVLAGIVLFILSLLVGARIGGRLEDRMIEESETLMAAREERAAHLQDG